MTKRQGDSGAPHAGEDAASGEQTIGPPVPQEGEVDWDSIRLGLKERIRRRLDRLDAATREDLVHEALVGILRVMRREGVRNLEALMTTVAHAVCVDFLKRRTRWAKIVEPISDVTLNRPNAAPPVKDPVGDPGERVRFMIREFFAGSERCYQLALARLAGKDWKVVAAERGESHDSVRQKWTDCCRKLRAAAAKHPEWNLLTEWTHG